MILITGASGHIGRRTAELLSKNGHSLRLMVRSKNRAPQLSMSQVVQGDYAQPPTLDIAFSDVDVALIISGYAKPGERALLHKNFKITGAQPFSLEAYFTEYPQLLTLLNGSSMS